MRRWMVCLAMVLLAAVFSACGSSQSADSVPEVDEADEGLTLPAYEEK